MSKKIIKKLNITGKDGTTYELDSVTSEQLSEVNTKTTAVQTSLAELATKLNDLLFTKEGYATEYNEETGILIIKQQESTPESAHSQPELEDEQSAQVEQPVINTGPLRFTAVEASSSVSLTKQDTPDPFAYRETSESARPELELEYNVNNIEWRDYTIGDVIDLPNVNDYVMIRNKSAQDIELSIYVYYTFVMTGKIAASGSVNSLYRKDGSTFNLNKYQYFNLFKECISLTQAPELSATTLAPSCYSYMFTNCTSLTTPPELPATTLTVGCYEEMFNLCSSLKITNTPTNGATRFFTYPENVADKATNRMFKSTTGTYTSDPVSGGTYYWYN